MNINEINNAKFILGESPIKKNESKEAQKVLEVSQGTKSENAQASTNQKATDSSNQSKEAKEVAKKLQSMVDESNIRFVVKDPTGTGSNNVVIEVLNDHNQVVARIPEEVINDVHDQVITDDAKNLPKGMLVDKMVS